MKDLIKALEIFAKYTDEDCVHCEHDVMLVYVEEYKISLEDIQELNELSFIPSCEYEEAFASYRFGAC